MKILALDTATRLSGVAVYDTEGGAVVRRERAGGAAERLLVLVDEALMEAGLRPADLQGVVCGAGPGSFTGLRIGAATAKGLCFALGLPLVMVSSLRALAARYDGPRLVLPCLDAFQGKVYAQVVPGEDAAVAGTPLAHERAWDPVQLAAAIAPLGPRLAVLGDGITRHPGLLVAGAVQVDDDPAPHPLDLARLGAARLLRGEHDDLAGAVPHYVAPSYADIS